MKGISEIKPWSVKEDAHENVWLLEQDELFHFGRFRSSLVFDEVVCRLLVVVRRGRFLRLGCRFLLDEQRGRRQRGRSSTAACRRGGAVFPDRLKITLQIVDSASAAAANTVMWSIRKKLD